MNGYGLKTFAREIKYPRNHITGARTSNCELRQKLPGIGTETSFDFINPCHALLTGRNRKAYE